MYRFLKTRFSFLMCFLIIIVGCAGPKVSREFSDTMEDDSRVVIKIEYKPKSYTNSKGEKVGSYYFIAKHFFVFRRVIPAQGYLPKTHIYISFYDRKGHLLLKGFTPDGYAINFFNHEENTFDGGVEWKGQFTERIITVENFRAIHSITATKK